MEKIDLTPCFIDNKNLCFDFFEDLYDNGFSMQSGDSFVMYVGYISGVITETLIVKKSNIANFTIYGDISKKDVWKVQRAIEKPLIEEQEFSSGVSIRVDFDDENEYEFSATFSWATMEEQKDVLVKSIFTDYLRREYKKGMSDDIALKEIGEQRIPLSLTSSYGAIMIKLERVVDYFAETWELESKHIIGLFDDCEEMWSKAF